MGGLLDIFYDECAAAIGTMMGSNKTIGDAVMAVFNFPIRQDDHSGRPVLAAATSAALHRPQGRGCRIDRPHRLRVRGRHRH